MKKTKRAPRKSLSFGDLTGVHVGMQTQYPSILL